MSMHAALVLITKAQPGVRTHTLSIDPPLLAAYVL
jgi:hypothetical protein